MERALEGKSSPHKGKIIAFESLPNTNIRDELDEDFHFQDTYLLANTTPSNTQQNETKECHCVQCKDPFIDNEIYESFLNHPTLEVMHNPITIPHIQTHQFEDLELNRRRETNPQNYPIKIIQDRPLICFRNDPTNHEGDWKIAIPQTLIDPIIRWYHLVLGHCGHNRLYVTIRMNFAAPSLYQKCSNFQRNNCQRNKLLGPGYGLLPPRYAPLLPW